MNNLIKYLNDNINNLSIRNGKINMCKVLLMVNYFPLYNIHNLTRRSINLTRRSMIIQEPEIDLSKYSFNSKKLYTNDRIFEYHEINKKRVHDTIYITDEIHDRHLYPDFETFNNMINMIINHHTR